MRITHLILLALAVVAPAARAQGNLPPALREVGFDPRYMETVPAGLAFKDEAGRDVPSAPTRFSGPSGTAAPSDPP